MAPLTKADPETAAKMREINRTIWEQKTGIAVTVGESADVKLMRGERRQLQRRPTKNPRVNKDVTLTPFKGPDGEETTKVYIADAWPMDWESLPEKEVRRRIEQGQGAAGPTRAVRHGEEILYLLSLSSTRKRWTRGERRLRNRIARLSRVRNEISRRRALKQRKPPTVFAGRGPTPPNPANKKKKEEDAND